MKNNDRHGFAPRPLALGIALLFAAPAALASQGAHDPLVAIDRNRAAIIADIAQGFQGEYAREAQLTPEGAAAALQGRLAKLRADRLLAASLASSYASLKAILAEADSGAATAFAAARNKALGDANRDLVYTPLAPCRLIDTRGEGAPIQGGAFAPGERRAFVPAGACGVPATGVSSLMVSFTTWNLTPTSGGYLSLLGPGAPVAMTTDIFEFGRAWSAASTVVPAGASGQFDAFVANASAHLVVDVLGYFGPA
ncbi:MAG TPA: hypothetical protein PLE38_15560, partial [Usitatibacteraceae bacterium]|nr:hypothetical protein [Usitatibacteraceae bacterium]